MNVQRLNKLAKFLDELPPKKFDFAVVRNECGTVACAIGWTPTVFPKLVEIYDGEVRHIETGSEYYDDVAADLFDISELDAERLFTPCAMRPWASRRLSSTARPKNVAKSIRDFIKWKKTQS